jgi:hypothetical protein
MRRHVLAQKTRVFDAALLTAAEQDYLLTAGYVSRDFVPIGETRQRPFYVKANYPEGIQHTFLVWNIVQVMKDYTTNVQTYATVRPDIVFSVNNVQVALEVEMGGNLRKNIKRLIEKQRANNARYKGNWYFVPYHSRDAPRYRKFGKVVRRTEIKKLLQELFGEIYY